MTETYLFDDHYVELVPESLEYGNNWARTPAGFYEARQPEILKWLTERIDSLKAPVLYDIGASTGVASLLPVTLPRLHVEAFEPNGALATFLNANLALNGIASNVNVYARMALGDRHVTLPLKVPKAKRDYGLGIVGGNPLRAPMETFDIVDVFMLDELDLPRPDVIKLDVEGAELNVLRGARRVLEDAHPALVLEVDPRNTLQFGHTPEDVLAFLTNFGYHFEWLNKDNVIAWVM